MNMSHSFATRRYGVVYFQKCAVKFPMIFANYSSQTIQTSLLAS